MIGHFPTPYPDELLYSACARYQDYVKYENKLFIGQELFGERAAGATIDLPCYLGYLIENLPPGHCWTVDHIIDERTLFPYFRPFLSPERVSRVNESMQGRGCLIAKIVSGSAATSIHLPGWLRYCTKCFDADMKLYREPYWHRLHQVPGVEVCPMHHVFLENSTARARHRDNIHDYVSARRAIHSTVSRQLDRDNPAHQVLLKVARDSAWLLGQRRFVPGLQELRSRYLQLLGDAGVASQSGFVWSKKLVRALEDYYSPGLLQSLQCGISKGSLSNWASVLVKDLNRGKFHHPLRHLLLIQTLGHTAESFFSIPTRYSSFGNWPWPCLNPVCGHYKQSIIRECSVSSSISLASGKKRKVMVGTFLCSCGFTYCRRNSGTAYDDVFRVDRVKSYGPVWNGALAKLWVDPLLTLEDIALHLCGNRRADQRIKIEAAKLGLPFPRRYKTCRPARKYKKRRRSEAPSKKAMGRRSQGQGLKDKRLGWLQVLSQNPSAIRTELRDRFSSLYKWLNTNDRRWLRNHLPPKRDHFFDWASLDKKLTCIVAESAERIRSAVPPRRVTIFALGQDTGFYDYLRKRLDKLPETARAMERVLESRLEFTKRKIRIVAESIKERGGLPAQNELLKLAGVSRDLMLDPDVLSTVDDALRRISIAA